MSGGFPDAVPTDGPRGVRFRSRLEARWAAFFTLCGWAWQYEPDLGLDGWIPDFALNTGGGLLVEVKPAVTVRDFGPHYARVERSGAVAWVWLAGAALFYDTNPDPVCGMMNEFLDGMRLKLWKPCTIADVRRRINAVNPASREVAQRLWVKAGNALQWRRM